MDMDKAGCRRLHVPDTRPKKCIGINWDDDEVLVLVLLGFDDALTISVYVVDGV